MGQKITGKGQLHATTDSTHTRRTLENVTLLHCYVTFRYFHISVCKILLILSILCL